MSITPLQKFRYQYIPKLPGMLRNGIAEICVKEGVETQSVADQEKIMILAKISQLPIDNFFILCYDIYIWDFLTV